MRSRPTTWVLLSVMLVVTGAGVWRLGKHWAAKRSAAPVPSSYAASPVADASSITPSPPVAWPSQPARFEPVSANTQHATRNRLLLTNTATPLAQLVRRPSALLLENAVLDTAQPLALPIPDYLRAQGDAGAYIVQSRAPLNDAFRARLRAAGAAIVAYIPNQAYLVRASQAVAQQLQAEPQTQAVVPYEPYFKLKPPLLALAVDQQPLPEGQTLNLLLFPDAATTALDELKKLGVEVLGQERSPFGLVFHVRAGSADIPVGPSAPSTQEQSGLAGTLALPALARLPSVQEIEPARARVMANDLSRARLGVAADSVTPDNYLGLTGTNVLINVSDSGVDTKSIRKTCRTGNDVNESLLAMTISSWLKISTGFRPSKRRCTRSA